MTCVIPVGNARTDWLNITLVDFLYRLWVPDFPFAIQVYIYCIIVHIFKHPKCVNENQQRGNLSERVYSSQTGGVAPALREIYLSWARVALPLPTISFLIQHPRENWGGVVMNLKAKCLGIAR